MSTVPVQVIVAPSPQVAVEVAGAAPITVTTGLAGPPGPPGPTGPQGTTGTSGDLIAGEGLIGGGSMSHDVALHFAVDDLVPGVAVYDPLDYLPIYDSAKARTIRVPLAEVLDGGVF